MTVTEINEDTVEFFSAQIGENISISIDKKHIPKNILSILKVNDMLITQCNLGCEELDQLFFYDFELINNEDIEESKKNY